MTDPNSMTGYDAATVEACAKVADRHTLEMHELLKVDRYDQFLRGEIEAASSIARNIRALPIAPPAPLVTADDVALIGALRKAVIYYRANDWPESDTELLTQAADAIARRAAPAVDETLKDCGPHISTGVYCEREFGHLGSCNIFARHAAAAVDVRADPMCINCTYPPAEVEREAVARFARQQGGMEWFAEAIEHGDHIAARAALNREGIVG